MIENGVPMSALVGEDHMQVRAALVKLLGGGNEALVWTRIEYRTRHVAFAHEHAGRQWWEIKQAALGIEVGLKPSQVETAVKNLVRKGFLLAEQHALPMQTYSYSPVILQSGDSRIGSVPIPEIRDSSAEIPGLQSGDLGIPPLYEEREDVQEAPVVPVARSEQLTSFVLEQFEKAWAHWPRKESKKKAVERFLKLPDPLTVSLAIRAHGDAHKQFTPVQFVPHLVTWLNQERWNDPLPQPRDDGRRGTVETSRAAAQLLRERREQSQLQAVGQ